ncbi:MAG: hypothetical protein KA109_11540 [Saprospiraceae bacterium]|nr:hypothetical protein [Saprospiraceae bacterium]MBK6815493.1 hypothetical protein [Saprospiraceae bacterium]MBK7607919.1 hypothetical protein [Saprospiraceae bacterium]MBK8279634.1 hypothetical protein [Saprospiraceae bacterium]MBK8778793.1 hypothetical protein [Saprospiraceae bacterium]
MKTGTYNIDLGFDQILDLVRQLPRKEKIRLSKELEREIIDAKLSALLKAFKTDDLDQETIDTEVEIVRTKLYVKSKA